MTTIAWDGRTLAADRCRMNSVGIRQTICKLHDCNEFMYAGTGSLSEVPVIARWLRNGAKWEDRPSLEEGGTAGIVVRKSDGATFLIEGKTATLCALPEGPTASGSGMEFALAAMACGKTAADAVRVAARFDSGTGFGVDSWTYRKRKGADR